MNDQYTEPLSTTENQPARHRSVMMALAGVIALLVAAWCLADGPFLVRADSVPWALLAIGIVVGIGLVASGFRRK